MGEEAHEELMTRLRARSQPNRGLSAAEGLS